MLVHDGADLCLLGRGPDWGQRRFSTLAGFVEPGESLEAAVAREVFEEVGVSITDVRYVASQPWPFPSSLMLGFTALLDGDPTLHLDPKEIAEAYWFTRDEVRQAALWSDGREPVDNDARLGGVSPQLSISRYLIDGWLARPLVVRRASAGHAPRRPVHRRMPRIVKSDDDVRCAHRVDVSVVVLECRQRPGPFVGHPSSTGAGAEREVDRPVEGQPMAQEQFATDDEDRVLACAAPAGPGGPVGLWVAQRGQVVTGPAGSERIEHLPAKRRGVEPFPFE